MHRVAGPGKPPGRLPVMDEWMNVPSDRQAARRMLEPRASSSPRRTTRRID